MDLDVVIVGGGPIGLCCGIECEKSGLKYCILEKGTLVNSLYNFPRQMTFFSTSKLLEIGDVPFISHGDKPTRVEALEYYRRVREHWGLNVKYYEKVEDVIPNHKGFVVKSAKKSYNTANVILATGFYDHPRMLGIPGEKLPHVTHYYTDVHPYIGHDVVVIGAANSACDVALELFHKECNVSMVIRGPELYKGVKYWIRPNIENRIKEGSICAYFNHEPTEIMEKSIRIRDKMGEEKIIRADFILAMTGYRPNFDFFESLGIRRHPTDNDLPWLDPDTLETNVEGIFMAGVAVAGNYTSKLFIENTRQHGPQIIQKILNKTK